MADSVGDINIIFICPNLFLTGLCRISQRLGHEIVKCLLHMRACVLVYICSCFYVNLCITFIYEPAVTRLAENDYRIENMSIKIWRYLEKQDVYHSRLFESQDVLKL